MLKIHNLIKSSVKQYILRTSLTVEDSALPLQRAWVLPLDMEIRSHMPDNEPLYLKKKIFLQHCRSYVCYDQCALLAKLY